MDAKVPAKVWAKLELKLVLELELESEWEPEWELTSDVAKSLSAAQGFVPKIPLGGMAPSTIALVPDALLVDALFDANHGMDHAMESYDTLLQIHLQLCAQVATHTQVCN